MQKIVVDSSVIVKWLNQQDEGLIDQADKLLRDVQENKVTLFAPELSKYEIGNALLLRKKLSIDDAQITLNNLFTLPIQFIDQSEELAKKTYKIAQEINVTYYDATFIALAKQIEAILITNNIKHQGKTKDITVISLEDY